MCATQVVFKGTGTIWLRCHRSRRQDREDRTLQMLPLTTPRQPLEISLERPGQSMSLYVPLSKGTHGWADTTTPHGRLLLTVLGCLAEFERDLIRARTGEGRARAKARGVKLGRRPKLTPHQKREAIERRDKGEALVEIARTYNVSHSTISRLKA